jgi:hypothetical protein
MLALVVGMVVVVGYPVAIVLVLALVAMGLAFYVWAQRTVDRRDESAQALQQDEFASPAAFAIPGYPKGVLVIDRHSVRWTPNHPDVSSPLRFDASVNERAAVVSRGRFTRRATVGVVVGGHPKVFLLAARADRVASSSEVDALLRR